MTLTTSLSISLLVILEMVADCINGRWPSSWHPIDPTAQGELIRKVYAKGEISVNISGDGLIKHATDMASTPSKQLWPLAPPRPYPVACA